MGLIYGVDGFKPGSNNTARRNLSLTARRGDVRLIVVVMGSDWDRGHHRDAAALLEYGFGRVAMERHSG